MYRIIYMVVFAFAALLICNAAVASNLSPTQVISHPAQYNGQEITISGKIDNFKSKTSRSGNAYETFKICDDKSCVDVFAWGTAPRNEGAQITVTGHFWQVKNVGRYTFYNELDLNNGQ